MSDGPITRSAVRMAILSLPGLPLHGCALRGAPAFELFGAYFPLWLLSALVGIAGAVLAYRLSVRTGLAAAVPFPLLVNTSVGVIVALVVWMLGTGQIL